jgi:hypothetical protein
MRDLIGCAVLPDASADLVRELVRRGVDAEWHHAGGGLMTCRVLCYDDVIEAAGDESLARECWQFAIEATWCWSADAIADGGASPGEWELAAQGEWLALDESASIMAVADAVEDQLRVGYRVASTGCTLLPV